LFGVLASLTTTKSHAAPAPPNCTNSCLCKNVYACQQVGNSTNSYNFYQENADGSYSQWTQAWQSIMSTSCGDPNPTETLQTVYYTSNTPTQVVCTTNPPQGQTVWVEASDVAIPPTDQPDSETRYVCAP
jgi:hypothetical protein